MVAYVPDVVGAGGCYAISFYIILYPLMKNYVLSRIYTIHTRTGGYWCWICNTLNTYTRSNIHCTTECCFVDNWVVWVPLNAYSEHFTYIIQKAKGRLCAGPLIWNCIYSSYVKASWYIWKSLHLKDLQWFIPFTYRDVNELNHHYIWDCG